MEVKDPRLSGPGFLQDLARGALLPEVLLSCSGCGTSAVRIEEGEELEIVAVEG